MRPSRYNVILEHPDDGRLITYNGLYGSLTIWAPEESPVVKRLLTSPEPDSGSSGIARSLCEQRYLVESSLDELDIVRNRKATGMSDPNRLDLILLPTLDCNFACAYCYETRRPGLMSDEVELAVKRWLAREIPRRKLLMLHWFGGEPLIAFRRILSITRHAADVARETGVHLVANVTTNGYLLTPERATALADVGIHNFQVTLDGPRDAHDRLRVLRDGRGTFERISHNLVGALRKHLSMQVSLRINFNHTNLRSIPDLLRSFPAEIRPRLRIALEPIFGSCHHGAVENLPEEEISSFLAESYELARELGYDSTLGTASMLTGRFVYCYAEREHQMVIGPEGDVFKCSVSDFQREDRLGRISPEGELIQEAGWRDWMSLDVFEPACESCRYLPLCMGGCRKMRAERGSTGSYCALVPTNTTYALKQLFFGNFAAVLHGDCEKGGAS